MGQPFMGRLMSGLFEMPLAPPPPPLPISHAPLPPSTASISNDRFDHPRSPILICNKWRILMSLIATNLVEV